MMAKPTSIWLKWYYGYIEAFVKQSFLDSSPWKETIKFALDGRKFERKVSFVAVDIQTGDIRFFNESLP